MVLKVGHFSAINTTRINHSCGAGKVPNTKGQKLV